MCVDNIETTSLILRFAPYRTGKVHGSRIAENRNGYKIARNPYTNERDSIEHRS